MDTYEKMIDAVMKGDLSVMNDCFEEGVDIEKNNCEIVRTAKFNALSKKQELTRAEAVITFLECYMFADSLLMWG